MKKPDFIIGGAQKSGTTTLMIQLSKHPELFVPQKELHFFSERKYDPLGTMHRGLEWYRSHFPDNDLVCGEKTPNYIFNKNAPETIKKYLPNVKFIFILRDPVKRAYSQYWMRYRNRGLIESDSFKNAVKDRNCEYLERGKYWKQLKRFYDVFDKNQIKVFILKDLKENPKEVYKEIYDFLGVNEWYADDIDKNYYRGGQPRFHWLGTIRHGVTHVMRYTNSVLLSDFLRTVAYAINLVNVKGQFVEYLTGEHKKSYPPMDDEVEEMLYQYFKPYNEKLKKKFPELNIEHWFQ